MSVEELSRLHRRYIDLSARFKSAWTYHQFLQGLKKILMDGSLAGYSADFQGVYSGLKAVSDELNAAAADKVRPELESIGEQIEALYDALMAEDHRVTPALLRMFFQRVKNYDDAVLMNLIKFYIYSMIRSSWETDCLDKVDFLVTKLAEEAQGPGGPYTLRERPKVRMLFTGLWSLLEGESISEEESLEKRGQLEESRYEVVQVESFDELLQKNLVQEYRKLKHSLGKAYFEPRVLLALAETNLAFKNKIAQLHRREERQIVSEYQQVFDLEQRVPVDSQLDQDLSRFREQVERFEGHLQRETLDLRELAELKTRMKDLLPRLSNDAAEVDLTEPSLPEATDPAAAALEGAPGAIASSQVLLDGYFKQLMEALAQSNFEDQPKAVAYSPELYPYRLEPREVVAYRRLYKGEECDPEVECFLLETAALRIRILQEVEEINSILDDSALTREAPVFGRARETIRLAGDFEKRLVHYVDDAVVEDNLVEAQQMQVERMRLLRELTGIWLLVHRPRSN